MQNDVATIAWGSDDDGRCPDCGLLSCVCFDDDDQNDAWDDEGWDECGMMPDGFCSQAGTEWCDWDCPRNRPSNGGQQS